MSSFRIRAANEGDLQHLYEMAKLTGGGFTNLPPEKKTLKAKLERSRTAFTRDVKPPLPGEAIPEELFVLMLENADTGEVRGTCQVFTSVGQRVPFYSYYRSTETKRSELLDRTFHTEVLTLVNDLKGSSEVGGLFLHPGERAGGLGLLLARSRYLFIARHRERFSDRILAELRGVIDEGGGSPFWDGVAGRFFGMNFQDADAFNAVHGYQFIADLMPKHPIYVALIPEGSRQVIGVPHPSGRAAMRMLENEGFAFENYLDIFDGGPTMTARTDQVKSIREARVSPLCALDGGGEPALVAAGELSNFRCAMGHVRDVPGGVAIDPACADLLGVAPGDDVMHVGR
ncbi:arginine N-succinyltransferase [Sphingomonas sp.]|uniref:arginine N-succinyltransferase n=1 Tax=Sphingomonas sp. TaxID=28214 RepID=UPI001B20AE2B|nr:arginine N-succinyltransferase [Sphingomonas sp.]MBO9713775.1 arginine N-succinyltransferase [Sphingomonas sp.]